MQTETYLRFSVTTLGSFFLNKALVVSCSDLRSFQVSPPLSQARQGCTLFSCASHVMNKRRHPCTTRLHMTILSQSFTGGWLSLPDHLLKATLRALPHLADLGEFPVGTERMVLVCQQLTIVSVPVEWAEVHT